MRSLRNKAMYLIRKGEKPRPVCRACRKAGPQGVRVKQGRFYLCKPCKKMIDAKLKAGEGVYLAAL